MRRCTILGLGCLLAVAGCSGGTMPPNDTGGGIDASIDTGPRDTGAGMDVMMSDANAGSQLAGTWTNAYCRSGMMSVPPASPCAQMLAFNVDTTFVQTSVEPYDSPDAGFAGCMQTTVTTGLVWRAMATVTPNLLVLSVSAPTGQLVFTRSVDQCVDTSRNMAAMMSGGSGTPSSEHVMLSADGSMLTLVDRSGMGTTFMRMR